MPFVAVGAEQRQVDTAANGSLTPALPSGTRPSDIVLAIGVRHTNQENSGFAMSFSISSGWTFLANITATNTGATRSQRLFLSVWAARDEPAPTISWTGTDQLDNGFIGDVAVCATYRPGGDLVDDLATNGDNSTGTTNAYTFDASDTGWVAGLHAFSPAGTPVTSVDLEGFTENARFDGPDDLRPALVLTERATPTLGTYDAPTWDAPLRAAQMIVGGFPVVRRGWVRGHPWG